MDLPTTLEVLVLHCGTNNLLFSSPKNIADGVLSIGIMAKRKIPNLQVVIAGLLDCDLDPSRQNVAKTNKVIKRKTRKLKDFFFMEQDMDWTIDSQLSTKYFIPDNIHLSKQGNEKFAGSIIRKLKDIALSSSLSSSMSDIILRIPTPEAPDNDISHVSPD